MYQIPGVVPCQALLLASTGTTFHLSYRQHSWYLVQFWLIKKTFSMELWVIVRIKIITIVFFFIKLVYTGVIIINQRIPLYKMCNCCHITHNQDNWNGLCLTLIDMSLVLQGRKQYCRIAVENADRFGDYLTQLTMCNIRFKIRYSTACCNTEQYTKVW